MSITGFVFDFDGLILDTEIPRFTAWQEVFASYGFPLTFRDWWKTIGTGPSAYDPGQHIYELTHGLANPRELYATTNKRTNELLVTQTLLPGVEAFIAQAFEKNIPMAIASSSDRDWVVRHLQRFNLLHYFKAIFTAEDVDKVKPDPALYQLALKSLKVAPGNSIAFEDSPNGIKAAKAAGMFCIAIPNCITHEMDLSLADKISTSFIELKVESLIQNHI